MEKRIPLRYGMNPHQGPAELLLTDESPALEVLNGDPGYINLLDALNAWQLVRDLKSALDLPAAASFKHVSPAGAAVSLPLSEAERKAYFVEDMELSSPAVAYARARGADRVSSYGDFVALSDPCDVSTAKLIAREVSHGIIAPGYQEEALGALRKKREGRYLILRMDPDFVPPEMESRQVYGITLRQHRNDAQIGPELFGNIVSRNQELPEEAVRDLIVALVTLKYTQSNSVCFACNGQTIGVGAGQQSRVHCTRLAAGKADLWWLRQHPKVLALEFRPGLSRAEKNNVIDQFLSDDLTAAEEALLRQNLAGDVERLSREEKRAWLDGLTEVSLASDAYLPFRDSLDRAEQSGVRYVAAPGGSARDEEVIAAADEHGMVLAFIDIRLFHH